MMNGVINMNKTCPRCKETKDASAYGHSSRTKSGLYVYCRLCTQQMDKIKRERRKASPPSIVRESKTCRLCNSIKPIGQFVKSNNTPDKHLSYCKPCWVVYVTKQQKKAKQNVVINARLNRFDNK